MQELHWKDEGMRWHKQFILSELALFTRYFLLILLGTLLLSWLLKLPHELVFLWGVFFLMGVVLVPYAYWDFFEYRLQDNQLSITHRNTKTLKPDKVATFELSETVVRRKKVFDSFTFLLIKVKDRGYYVYVENGSEAQRQLMAQFSEPASVR